MSKLLRGRFLPIAEAKEYVHPLGISSMRKWLKYVKENHLPPGVPASPRDVYLKDGWKGWGDWLGTGRIATQEAQFLPHDEARLLVCGRGIQGYEGWREYIRTNSLPKGVPRSPIKLYENAGWQSWGYWLGHERVTSSKKLHGSFEEARAYARSLGLSNSIEWYQWVKTGKRPSDIPYNPPAVYADRGWAGWADWLHKPSSGRKNSNKK